MLKQLFTSILLIMSLTSNSQVSTDDSIHQFKVADISGNIFDFSELKGKKVMIVNTASKCGLTYQYESLQKLYSQYKDFNFVIIGFPSNDFLWQEPGSNEQIQTTLAQLNFIKWCIKNDILDYISDNKTRLFNKQVA